MAKTEVAGNGEEQPFGELQLRTLTMPADTNPAGDIFGGWLVSQMDMAGGILARSVTEGRAVTVSIDSMTFHQPVKVGDVIACFGGVERIGRTSIALRLQAWVLRQGQKPRVKVTEGLFTFVAVDDDGRPRIIRKPDGVEV